MVAHTTCACHSVIIGRWMAKINSEEVQSLEDFIARIKKAFSSIQLATQISQVRRVKGCR